MAQGLRIKNQELAEHINLINSMELTPKQQKRLDKLVALEDNANLVIVDEIEKAQYEELKNKFEKKEK